jgi:hypothetical protein
MHYVDYLPIILVSLSGITFISYGFSCLINGGMTKEFERYGLVRFRKFVGLLELLGGLGSLVGLMYPYLLIFSSAGLTILMLMGIVVRLRLKDRFLLILPAIILMLINGFILFFYSF